MKVFDVTEVGDATRSWEKAGMLMMSMTPMQGKGKEICDRLREELSIPKGVISFEVKFDVGDVIRVRCDYVPRASGD